MRPIWRESSSPMRAHVAPASVDLYMPLPCWMLERMSASPLPTYTTFGSLGATATAPIDATGCESMIGVHVRPALPLFHTPPPTAPM